MRSIGRMKKTIFGASRAALAVAIVSMVAACTSVQEQAGTSEAMGVMCNKCKTTWVAGPVGKPGGYSIYRTSRKMQCPQCETIVETFFRTGRLEHSCPGCGGTMSRCTAQIVR